MFVLEDEETWLDELNSDRLSDQYFAALYWAIMTLTTIGYGDITAHSTLERNCFSVFMLIGAGMYAYIVGTMCSLIQGLDAYTLEFQRKMDDMNEFMHNKVIPQPLRLRIRRFMLYTRDAKAYDYATILKNVSPAIKNEILMFRFKSILENIPQFYGAPSAFLCGIAACFKQRKSLFLS